MKVLIRIAFYGKDYFGTQKQKKDKTIQGDFEESLSLIFNQEIKVTISSRLDRGVSALDYGISFSCPDGSNLDHLKYFLQRRLGVDVLIKDVREVDEDFSARYSCLYKEYLYLIQLPEKRNPLLNPISYVPTFSISKEKIEEALSLFVGLHDFRAFSTPEGEENTIQSVDEIFVKERDGILYLHFKAKSFLRYQIRFMVGAALQYCRGKVSLETISNLLQGKEEKYPKLRAEPQGLLLKHIEYHDIQNLQENVSFSSILFE